MWTIIERDRFFDGIEKYGRDWKKISELIGSRNLLQVQQYGSKFIDDLRDKTDKNKRELKLFNTFTKIRWSKKERQLFLEGLEIHGRDW